MSESVTQMNPNVYEFKNPGCMIKIEVVNNVQDFPETVQPDDLPSTGMSMADAILKMQDGHVIRHNCWKPKKMIGLTGNRSWFFRQDGRRYTPTAEDIIADDWEIA